MSVKLLSFLQKRYFFLFFLLVSSSLYAQNNTEIWDKLLNNQREEALQDILKQNSDTDIETYLLHQIVKMENGIMIPEEDFVKKLASFPDYENYLFAHWNMPYVFSAYLENGFDQFNTRAATQIDAQNLKNTTLKNALIYYQGVVQRYQNNWTGYKNTMQEINAVRLWEYCGVFENLNNSGLVTAYEPEGKTISKVPFDARSNGKVSWYTAVNFDSEPYQYFSNHKEYNGISYAQTFINSPSERRIHLNIGRGGLIRVWLNDVLVIDNDKDIVTEMDAISYAVTLQKGNNRVLVKLGSQTNVPYFILRLEDTEGNAMNDLHISLENKKYNKATAATINAVARPNSFVEYFKQKAALKNDHQYLYLFSTYLSYLRNSDFENAILLIKTWLEKYPNSSFLNSCLSTAYTASNDANSSDEIIKNIERKDPDYYLSLLNKFEKFEELMKQDIDTYKKTMTKIGASVNYPYIKKGAEFMIHIRNNDMDSIEYSLDRLLEDPSLPSSIKTSFTDFYSDILNDDSKNIKSLEHIINTSFNYQAQEYLSYYYNKQNRIDESLEVLKSALEHAPHNNIILYNYVYALYENKKYEETLPYIEKGLQNFPGSYTFLELKGDVYLRLNKPKEAITYYELALEKSNKTSLRKSLYDLKKQKDPLEKIHTLDAYAYIKEHRNKIKSNNYGLNILLEQIDVLRYERGGGRTRKVNIFEVTSQKGIDNLKEYNLGLRGDYVIFNSEIVKPDNSIIPAEKSGSNLVFNGLSIGDVVYVYFESNFTFSGRFYKDFIDEHSLDRFYPVLKMNYRLLSPTEDVHYKVSNGEVPLKNYKFDGLNVYEWEYKNLEGLPLPEDYMPEFSDVATKINISTISSWDDIANWYSDLVRSRIEFDATVKEAFTTIFPEGVQTLSENEKARRIYNYITSEFSYSYVSFKQSGFVPQKPSKTIKTKLGDCKDFSTLFVTLAKEAGLEANLVLILTSDHGSKDLILPSTDFNHCIAKVFIDGKPQYLELTSKYLSYKSLPISLHDATALEIPVQKDDKTKQELFKLTDVTRNADNFNTISVIEIGEEESNITLTTSASGHLGAYYAEMAEEKNPVVLKEDFYQELSSQNDMDITLLEINNIEVYKNNSDIVQYTAKVRLNEKTNAIGSLQTFQIPFFSNPYTQDISNLEERNYNIEYKKYENADTYNDNITIKLKEGKSFLEIPKDQTYTFEDHSYTVAYQPVGTNELKIVINAKPGTATITPVNYSKFKEYVKMIIESRKQFLAYK